MTHPLKAEARSTAVTGKGKGDTRVGNANIRWREYSSAAAHENPRMFVRCPDPCFTRPGTLASPTLGQGKGPRRPAAAALHGVSLPLGVHIGMVLTMQSRVIHSNGHARTTPAGMAHEKGPATRLRSATARARTRRPCAGGSPVGDPATQGRQARYGASTQASRCSRGQPVSKPQFVQQSGSEGNCS
ncbi:hypothetical protein CALCODRAFT_505436 [Calocera cornea HHB12733]|uniref:Uncharacterized protein n=1 Tax=Calocera cornea HHB12733 TaxID=1353952 RepID=A0A165K4J2_9BASI|nr:hypothetical protein CALCODRAFT_505436 [Calocera cornea HHB12733]